MDNLFQAELEFRYGIDGDVRTATSANGSGNIAFNTGNSVDDSVGVVKGAMV